MTAGDGAAEHPFLLQLMNGTAVGERQRGAVGHDISDPAGGPVIFQHCRGGSNHAVQLTDKHRHPGEALEAGQLRPISCGALFTAEHPHLPGSVTKLHDMAAAAKRGRRPAKIELHKVAPAAAQSEKLSGRIQQEQIAAFRRAGQPVVIQRLLLNALDNHLQLTDGSVPGKKSTGQTDSSTDQLLSNHPCPDLRLDGR